MEIKEIYAVNAVKGPGPNRKIIWMVIILLAGIVLLNSLANDAAQQQETVPLTAVVEKAKAGDVVAIKVQDDGALEVMLKDDVVVLSRKETSASLQEILKDYGVPQEKIDAIEVSVVPVEDNSGLLSLLLYVGLPIAVLIGFFLWMNKKTMQQNNSAMSFGKSKARMNITTQGRVTFADVAGADEAKQDLQEVVEFLKDPGKFNRLGARIPRGVLLVGPPGTGKTLLAKAVAGEAGVPFLNISGSEFVEMFVGVGASRVRDLFDQAKRNSPCIVFVDEIDAVGRTRGHGFGGSHDEREQTLNQILVEMDGFDTNTNVIVIAATNRADILDPALLRPGRFDRRVVVDRPDLKGRIGILAVHTRKKKLDPSVTLEEIARITPGFSGADLENLVNEAAILAARRDHPGITTEDLREAFERIVAGPERKSRVLSDKERTVVAYHEAGHAVVQNALSQNDPVYKISIISRGMALGYTMGLPEEDKHLRSKTEFEHRMAALLGGNVSEQVVFQDITTGASNDIEKATDIAQSMVMSYGMSERLGHRTFGSNEQMRVLARDFMSGSDYSDDTAREIDEEVKILLDRAYERAHRILTEQRDLLDEIAEQLIAVETLDGEALQAILAKGAKYQD